MTEAVRGVAILGSTGSIGTSALDLIERLNAMHDPAPAGSTPRRAPRFRVQALAANRNVDLLARQVRRFRPAVACIGTEELGRSLRGLLGGVETRIVWGAEGLREVATLPEAEFVLAGIVGAAGLEPTFAAVSSGKLVGLANKEALVLAGELMIRAARESGAVLLPIDSEHNALHQCLRGERIDEVRKLVLTASGGPFFSTPSRDLSGVSPEEALAHPTWEMGRKISIDSATLMNKALEVIEAHWLFGIPWRDISIVIHHQSTIHSMVEFVDGSFVCQLGAADMRHPIQYALTYPDRCPTPLEPLRLARLDAMTFAEPDPKRFPCLELGRRALEAGGTMAAALNAANEIAVESFLDRRIRLTDIPRIIRRVMDQHRPAPASSLEIILETDAWARRMARESTRTLDTADRSRTGGNASCSTR